MADTMVRERADGRLALCADAFLYTGALFLSTQGLLGIVATMATSKTGEVPEWVQAPGLLFMIASLGAGAVFAWLMHGRELRGSSWLGMLAGVVVGGPLMVAAFLALLLLGRSIPNPVPSLEGPWGLVLVLVVAVVAFLALPMVDAARDLGADHRSHVRLDWMRIAAFALITVVVIGTTIYSVRTGSEAAEAGIFMVPFAGVAAVAVLGADLLESWRAKRAHIAAPPAHA